MPTFSLSPVARQQFLSIDGLPLDGGLLYTYAAGSLTPQPTYIDINGSAEHTNPIVLDAGGFAAIWLDDSLAYKFILYDALGNLQWSVDDITASGSGGSGNGTLGNGVSVIDVTQAPFFADSTGIVDSTTAIQGAIALFSLDLVQTGLSGEIIFPPGKYKITKTLIVAGLYSANLTLKGFKGASILSYEGSATDSMMILYGMTIGPVVEGLTFNTNGLTTRAMHLTSDNGTSTTLGTAVVPGLFTVTPPVIGNIIAGTLLKIDSGPAAELIYVTAATPTTFTASFLQSHAPTATVGHGPTTQAAIIRDCEFNLNANGYGIWLGNKTGAGGSSQTSEIKIYDNEFYGWGTGTGIGTSISAIISVSDAQAGDFWTTRNRFHAFQIAIDVSGAEFSISIEYSFFGGSTVADISTGNGRNSLVVLGNESEPANTALFINLPGSVNFRTTLIQNNEFSPVGMNTDPYYVIGGTVGLAGAITLIGNSFYNVGGSATPRVKIGGPVSINATVTLFSTNNFFTNAIAGDYAPFYDGSGNKVLPTYYNNQALTVTSIGDHGGVSGTSFIALKNYIAVDKIVDHLATSIPTIGILACGTISTAVAFRSNSGTFDISGMSKDATDIITVGDTQGIIVPGPQNSGGITATAIKTTSLARAVFDGSHAGYFTPGGVLVSGTTYTYYVTVLDGAGGETLRSVLAQAVTPLGGGSTFFTSISWAPVPKAAGYNVYGRTGGTFDKITPTPVSPTHLTPIGGGLFNVFFQDDGSVTPSGAIPTVDTTARITSAGSVTVGSFLSFAPLTFATLPGTPAVGEMAVITDSTVNTWGTAVTVGGGGIKVTIWHNGTNWTVLGV